MDYFNKKISSLTVCRASVSEAGDEKNSGTIKQYHVEKSFADRRYKVSSARTYFYLNEASCERNMDIFIKCLEAVASKCIFQLIFLSIYTSMIEIVIFSQVTLTVPDLRRSNWRRWAGLSFWWVNVLSFNEEVKIKNFDFRDTNELS